MPYKKREAKKPSRNSSNSTETSRVASPVKEPDKGAQTLANLNELISQLESFAQNPKAKQENLEKLDSSYLYTMGRLPPKETSKDIEEAKARAKTLRGGLVTRLDTMKKGKSVEVPIQLMPAIERVAVAADDLKEPVKGLDRRDSQAEFTQEIITRAKKIALKKGAYLLFDPQGRVLVDIQLNEQDATDFKTAFGRPPSALTISVNLDVTKDESLNELYRKKYPLSKDQQAVVDNIRGSIIPLQQEFHFHLGLSARTLTKINENKFPQELMAIAHNKAMAKINVLVIAEFNKALNKATNPKGEINDKTLIHALDKARKTIFSQAQNLLRDEVLLITGHAITKEEAKIIKHTAETTTATPNELLYTDHGLGLATWIGGSEVTAHDRGLGQKHLADRQIATLGLGVDDTVVKIGRPRLQIRTPSLDVKDSKLNADGEVGDISEKLLALNKKYSMATFIEPSNGTKAFTYNLYTAINDTPDDLQGKNMQSQGAMFILLGAHEYNQRQIKTEDPVLCFVQNQSVNGFGDALGYGKDELTDEATLMAEMAMLHNLAAEGDETAAQVRSDYILFLQANDQPYFSQSRQGKSAQSKIATMKAKWAAGNVSTEGMDLTDKAKAALRVMVANNLHQSHEFTKLFQSLSVFVEQASIGGCKSGNERAQAINGRVALFDSVVNAPDSELVKAIVALATAPSGTALTVAQKLKSAQDSLYDKHLQAAAGLISNGDQAAAAKVKAQDKAHSKIDRNYAEEPLDHLSQSGAGQMQAHKGLPVAMAEAWGHPMSFGKYIKSQFLNVKGVAIFLISGPLFPLIAYASYSKYKSDVQTRYTKRIDELKDRASTVFQPINEGRIEAPTVVGQSSLNEKQIETQDRLLSQIGDYTKYPKSESETKPVQGDKEFVASILDHVGRIELYEGIAKKELKKHRKAFVQFISKLDADASKNAPTDKHPGIKMRDYLGKEGLALYKAALQEEINSEAYRNAVFRASTTHFQGPKLTERLVVHVAGPSACGKSYAAEAAVKAACNNKTVLKNLDDRSGNDVVAIDGGVVRQVSQMRKLVIRAANNHGYKGLLDLDKQSTQILEPVKNKIQKATFKAGSLSCVIPDTNSNWLSGNEAQRIRDIDEMKNTKQVFCRVEGADPTTFKQVVKFMGNKRAWKTDFTDVNNPGLDLNSTQNLTESKAYGSSGFEFGKSFSERAHDFFNNYSKKGNLSLVITNELMLLKKDTEDTWVPTEPGENGEKMISTQIYNDWVAVKKTQQIDLDAYARENLIAPIIPDPLVIEPRSLFQRLKEFISNRSIVNQGEQIGTDEKLGPRTKAIFTVFKDKVMALKQSTPGPAGGVNEKEGIDSTGNEP